MRTLYIALIIVMLLCLTIFIDNINDNSNREDIIGYCRLISNDVVLIDRCYIELGPFYYRGEGNSIYKVTTDKHTIWFRKGFWYNDIEITN